MKILSAILATCFTLLTLTSNAQLMPTENRITVIGESSIEIPADQITYQVTIQYSNPDDIKGSYAQHKDAEAKLLTIVRGLNIPTKDIQYSLINIEKIYNYNNVTGKQDITYGTRQTVTFTTKEINRYAEIMFRLIENGFREVNTMFTSSKENSFNDELIKKAMENASQKAEAMAKYGKRRIKEVTTISETDESGPRPIMLAEAKVAYAGGADSNNFAEIPQTIKKRLQLRVVYSLIP